MQLIRNFEKPLAGPPVLFAFLQDMVTAVNKMKNYLMSTVLIQKLLNHYLGMDWKVEGKLQCTENAQW